MNPFMRVLAASAIAGTLAAPALAQSAVSQTAPGPVASAGNRRVTLDLKDVAPASAFKALADAIGVTVTVDAGVTAPVDIKVRNVTAKTALNAMCESVGCQWTFAGGGLAVKPGKTFSIRALGQEPGKLAGTRAITDVLKRTLPADMRFENAPLDVVSTRLSEALGLPVRISCKDPAAQTLTIDLGNQTLQSVLKHIVEQETRPAAVWQMMIGPSPGDSETPSFGIMISPKGVKQGASTPRKLEILVTPKDEKKK